MYSYRNTNEYNGGKLMGKYIKRGLTLLIFGFIMWICLITQFMAEDYAISTYEGTLSFLTFKYNTGRKTGTLWYENIQGKKIKIGDNVLGDGRYFYLFRDKGLYTI